MFTANIANAAYVNLGTLDVRPVQGQEANPEWFVEYAKPGESMIRYIQIANFSPEKQTLEIYSSDSSKNLDQNFTANPKEQSSQKIAPWMTMPAQTLDVNSGETKIVPVKITVPDNAGVGLHTGAIMVREKNKADGTEFHIEKGVRLYLNVKGGVLDKTQIASGQFTQNFTDVGANVVVENKGTVDYDTPVTLAVQNLYGQTVAQQKVDVYARPGEKTQIKLQTEKPAFGIYNIVLQSEQNLNGQTNITVGTIVAMPWWSLIAVALLAMAGALFVPSKQQKRAPEQAFSFGNLFKKLEFQKATSFLGILLVSGLVSLPLINMQTSSRLFTDVLKAGNSEHYTVTIKWGDFRKGAMTAKSKTDWHGQISFTDAKATLQQSLNLEAADAVNVINDGSAVNFNLTTDKNNDGIILNVIPTSDNSPSLTFENYPSKTKSTLDLNKLAGSTFLITNGRAAATITVSGASANGLHGATNSTEGNATPEIEATPEVNINIPELKSIFQDIPATPEVLSEFILTSDYVKKITTENALTKIETDPTLIKALEATPEIIEEITATPNLNFTFVPSGTVTFPPQQFSFKQDKTTTQDLGTIIFVQNKETPWNTYIGTTNFVSLSGRGVIAAGNLTVIPGDAKILKQEDGAQVNEGTQRTMQGTFDKSIIVNVQPDIQTSDTKTIFSMNPQLKIKIPKGTPPGRYRGLLTITSL